MRFSWKVLEEEIEITRFRSITGLDQQVRPIARGAERGRIDRNRNRTAERNTIDRHHVHGTIELGSVGIIEATSDRRREELGGGFCGTTITSRNNDVVLVVGLVDSFQLLNERRIHRRERDFSHPDIGVLLVIGASDDESPPFNLPLGKLDGGSITSVHGGDRLGIIGLDTRVGLQVTAPGTGAFATSVATSDASSTDSKVLDLLNDQDSVAFRSRKTRDNVVLVLARLDDQGSGHSVFDLNRRSAVPMGVIPVGSW